MNKQIDFEKKMAEITADVSNRAKAFKYVQFYGDGPVVKDPIPNSPKMAKRKVDQEKAADVYDSYAHDPEVEKALKNEESVYVSSKDAKTLAKSAWASYAFLMNVYQNNTVFFDNEQDKQLLIDEIAKSPEYSFDWANDWEKGRFVEGEEAIATDAGYSLRYADECLNGRFVEGEYAIATDPLYSYLYANKVLKADFYIDGILICKKGRGFKRG